MILCVFNKLKPPMYKYLNKFRYKKKKNVELFKYHFVHSTIFFI